MVKMPNFAFQSLVLLLDSLPRRPEDDLRVMKPANYYSLSHVLQFI